MDSAAVEKIKRNPGLVKVWMEAGKVELLVEVLLEPRVPLGLRVGLMNDVPCLGDRRFVPALVQLLSVDHGRLRGRAARALGDCAFKGMPVQEAIPALLRCAEDDDEYVRMMALIALSEMGEQRAVPAFLELAERSPVSNYRRSAAAALAKLGAPEAEAYFMRYLDDRETAAWAAGWLEDIGTGVSLGPLRAAAGRDRANRDDYRRAVRAIEERISNAAT